MLLVQGKEHRLVSTRREQIATPYRMLNAFDSIEGARDFIGRFAGGDHLLHTALTEETTRGWASSQFGIGERDLILATAQGVAAGLITLVAPIKPRPQVIFDPGRPRAPGTDTVWFPTIRITGSFLTYLHSEKATAASLRAALRHEAGLRGISQIAGLSAWAATLRKTRLKPHLRDGIELDLTEIQIARLLFDRWLILLPLGQTGETLRLAWRYTGGSGSEDAESAGAEPPPPKKMRAPTAPEGPRSRLPTPPDKTPRQAECLMAAAQLGYPLVDDCAPPPGHTPPKTGPANPAVRNGAAKNGPAKNGPATNGPATNGPATQAGASHA